MRINKWYEAISQLDLEISFADQNMLALLYMRDVWRVDLEPDIPCLSPLPIGAGTKSPRPVFPAEQWSLNWQQSVTNALAAESHLTQNDGSRTQLPTLSPYELFERLSIAPEDFSSWVSSCMQSYHRSFPRPRYFSKLVPALTTAAQAGLKRIILLPVEGNFYRWAGSTLLIISPGVEGSLPAYSAALADAPEPLR